jgi:hypothetical protein
MKTTKFSLNRKIMAHRRLLKQLCTPVKWDNIKVGKGRFPKNMGDIK